MKTKIVTTIISSLLITIFLALPDIMLNLLPSGSPKILKLDYIAAFFLVALLLVVTKNSKLRYFICSIFFMVQLIATMHIAYFGNDLTPEIALKVLANPSEDFWEISLGLKDSPTYLYLITIAVILCYIAIFYILAKSKNSYKSLLASIAIVILVAVPFIRIPLLTNPYLMYPNPLKPSLYNGFNLMAYITLHNDNTNTNSKKYAAYQVEYNEPLLDNIIIIMGESIRDDYLSIFSPNFKTTPFLEQSVKQGDAVAANAISGAVATSVSLPLFFNGVLEPGNSNAILKKDTNLFSLAKKQGYKTILLSAQSSGLLHGTGYEKADYIITRESIKDSDFDQKRDLVLIDYLKTVPLAKKNLIILHMRSQHSPYSLNYSNNPDLAIYSNEQIAKETNRVEKERMQYSNATKFTDYFLKNVFEYSKTNISNGRTAIFFTSDHGEMLGEDGLFGHNHLRLDCANVPFIVFDINNANIKDEISHMGKTSHYDITKLISAKMGATIINPNDTGMRFVHGSISGSNEKSYIEYSPNDTNVAAKF